MVIISFDLGIKTGFAVKCNDLAVVSGTYYLEKRPKYRYKRYLQFYHFVDKMIKDCESLDLIAYEKVMFHMRGATAAAHLYGFFEGIVIMLANKYNIELLPVPVGTIKMFIAGKGKGNASKIEVIAAVEKLGYKPKDDNEADAIALLEYCISL